MKKIFSSLAVLVILMPFLSVVAQADDTPIVSNLVIEIRSTAQADVGNNNSQTGTGGQSPSTTLVAKFKWRTDNIAATSKVFLYYPANSTTEVPGGRVCSGYSQPTQNHCYQIDNLVANNDYSYKVKPNANGSEPSCFEGHSCGTFKANIGDITPGANFNFALDTVGDATKTVQLGSSTTFTFKVRNTGNTDDTINISRSNPSAGWGATPSTDSVAVRVNDAVEFTLTVGASSSVTTGSSLTVTVTGTSSHNQSLTRTANITATATGGAVSTPGDGGSNTTPVPGSPPPPPPGPANRTISGSVTFSDGSPVTDAKISIYNSATGSQTVPVGSNGRYSVSVSAGTWYVNVLPLSASSNWTASDALAKQIVFTDSGPTSAPADFTIVRSSARFTAYVKKPDGSPAVGVGVAVIKANISGSSQGRFAGLSRTTDAFGLAVFSLAPGAYQVRVAVASASGFVEADRPSFSLVAGDNKSATIELKQANLYITGTVKHADGRPAPALVWAWSESGGSSETRSSSSGEFSIPVTKNTRWHIGAGRMEGNFGHKSTELVVSVGESNPDRVELVLEKLKVDLPQPVLVTNSAATVAVAAVATGAKVEVPATAAASFGNITVNIKPTVEVAAPTLTKIVGTVYDIDIKDQSGNKVAYFSKDLELTFPYDDKTLADLAVAADELVPSYYDEKVGDWTPIPGAFIDKVNKKVVVKINHLTRFALIAAADITAPAAPTGVIASKVQSNIRLTWVNPTADFRHSKIYRSTEYGKLGVQIFSEIFENTKTDTTATPGKTYYYTVRSVDPAGNESTNVNQVVATQLGQVVSALNRNLKIGTSGEDVGILQQILVKEGVYPEALVTRYFGNLTFKAVVRLQEKYTSEVLVPVGLSKGTGYVGASTRQKLSELKTKHSL